MRQENVNGADKSLILNTLLMPFVVMIAKTLITVKGQSLLDRIREIIMRTSQAKVNKLLNEAKREVGLESIAEVWAHVKKFEHLLNRRIDQKMTLSPYKNNTWSISGFISNDVIWYSKDICLLDWIDSPTALSLKVKLEIHQILKQKVKIPAGQSLIGRICNRSKTLLRCI